MTTLPATRGLTLMAQLEQQGVVTEQALNLDGLALTVDECEALASMFGKVKEITSWMVGDLIVYCEERFGVDVTYSDIAGETGLALQTVQNLASISRRVPPPRRVLSLRHSVHAEVASLPPKEQREWLAKARKGGWKRDELRAHLQASRLELEPAAVEVIPDPGMVIEAARTLVRNARESGDNALCRRGDVTRLRSLLGEP